MTGTLRRDWMLSLWQYLRLSIKVCQLCSVTVTPELTVLCIVVAVPFSQMGFLLASYALLSSLWLTQFNHHQKVRWMQGNVWFLWHVAIGHKNLIQIDYPNLSTLKMLGMVFSAEFRTNFKEFLQYLWAKLYVVLDLIWCDLLVYK